MADLNLGRVDAVQVTPDRNYLAVTIEGADDTEILSVFNEDDIVKHFDAGRLLDAIGREEALYHFDIKEEAEEE